MPYGKSDNDADDKPATTKKPPSAKQFAAAVGRKKSDPKKMAVMVARERAKKGK